MAKDKSSTPKPLIEVFDPAKDIAVKFDFYIKIVIAIFVVTTVVLIVSVGTLIVDSFHFNSVTYKEYSAKTETLSALQETNKTLLQTVKENQEIILENQETIKKLVQKINQK